MRLCGKPFECVYQERMWGMKRCTYSKFNDKVEQQNKIIYEFCPDIITGTIPELCPFYKIEKEKTLTGEKSWQKKNR